MSDLSDIPKKVRGFVKTAGGTNNTLLLKGFLIWVISKSVKSGRDMRN